MRPLASRLIVLTPLNTLSAPELRAQLTTDTPLKPTLVHFDPLHATLRHYMQRHTRVQALFADFGGVKHLKLQGKLTFPEDLEEV